MTTDNRTNSKAVGAGVLAALAASLCCITPFIAIIAGIGGIASTFSWVEPVRPYLMGFSLLALGGAWFQKLRTRPAIDCECEPGTKRSFLQSKGFLGIVTVFALVMLAFPYYAGALYATNASNQTSLQANKEPAAFELTIDGMTCTGCEVTIEQTALSLPGVISAEADYQTGKATIVADTSRISLDEVKGKIEETGYAVLSTNASSSGKVRQSPTDYQETKEKK